MKRLLLLLMMVLCRGTSAAMSSGKPAISPGKGASAKGNGKGGKAGTNKKRAKRKAGDRPFDTLLYGNTESLSHRLALTPGLSIVQAVLTWIFWPSREVRSRLTDILVPGAILILWGSVPEAQRAPGTEAASIQAIGAKRVPQVLHDNQPLRQQHLVATWGHSFLTIVQRWIGDFVELRLQNLEIPEQQLQAILHQINLDVNALAIARDPLWRSLTGSMQQNTSVKIITDNAGIYATHHAWVVILENAAAAAAAADDDDDDE